MKKNKTALDKYEQSIEDMAETLVPVSDNTRKKIDNIVEKARKSRSISLRISSYDLELAKTRAQTNGLPYQTLIAMVLHKYLSGQFIDKEEAMKLLSLR